MISACRESGVRKLIYNSTADVVFDGSEPIRDGDESLRRPLKVIINHCARFFFVSLFRNDICFCSDSFAVPIHVDRLQSSSGSVDQIC